LREQQPLLARTALLRQIQLVPEGLLFLKTRYLSHVAHPLQSVVVPVRLAVLEGQTLG
jgi:hypothetical protein